MTLIEWIILLLVIASIIVDGLTLLMLRDVLHTLVARESSRRGWKEWEL